MSLTQNNLMGVIAVCAWFCAHCGCSVPWTAPFSRHSEAAADRTETVHRASAGGQQLAAPPDRAGESVRAAADSATEPDLTGVLDKLEQVRAIDPAAEEQLMAELRKAPAGSWPLVAEQFRASLAYREQLASKRQTSRHDVARTESTSLPDAGSVSPTDLLANTRPSAPIGQLVDPRNADADGISSEALARSTPYSTPIGDQPAGRLDAVDRRPAEFAADGPSYPIRAQHEVTKSQPADRSSVVQARFDAHDELDTPASSDVVSEGIDSVSADPSSKVLPGDLRRGDDWRVLVESAAADLSRRTSASPATTAEVHQHASLRMLHLLAGDTEKALEPIPHISPVEQDYWSRQLFALATYLDHHSQTDDKRRAAASVIHLDQAVSSLRE
jgi:hypothetical protein